MTKHILSALLFILIFHSQPVQSQHVPNSDFETWQIGGVFLEAEDWQSSNILTVYHANPGFAGYSVEPDTGINGIGGFSARLKTLVADSMGNAQVGFIMSGTPQPDFTKDTVEMIEGGVPFPHRPLKLKGFYKYTSNSPIEDFGQAHVLLKKYDSTLMRRDTIGYGLNTLLNPSSTWRAFEVGIDYRDAATLPDSIIIAFYSTHPYSPQQGATLWIDSLSFDFSTAIDEPRLSFEVQLFPNPAKDQLSIHWDKSSLSSLSWQLFDMGGRLIKEQTTTFESSLTWDISHLPSNIYSLWVKEGKNLYFVKKLLLK